MRAISAEHVADQLRAGVIEPANSEWAIPVVFAPKKDEKIRLFIDYRGLNQATVPDTYLLPRLDDCIDSMGDASVFSTLEASCGYWQIPVAEQDRDKTCFNTESGTYRYVRMPFGLRNGPATFQRALDIILNRVRWKIFLIYLDDVIVFSPNYEQHVKDLERVLGLLKKPGVTLKLKKCRLFSRKVDHMGHTILPGKLMAADKPTKAIQETPFPNDRTKLRQFLGACHVYRRFILGYAAILRPLNAMLKKGADPNWTYP